MAETDTRDLPLYQVDAFADHLFAGNPAAVVPLTDWLPDRTLQAIAAENNLAETAYIVRQDSGTQAHWGLRWFTPKIEVDLCGHATLASAYVIARHLEPGCDQIRFESRSGPLEVSCEGEKFTLDFPADPPSEFNDGGGVAEAVGLVPQAVLKGKAKMLAVLENEAAVRAAAPDLAKVKALPSDGLIISAPGAACDLVSRYFAPHAGIPEDPVTGSAHCVLAPYWAERFGKTKLTARQLSERGGALGLELSRDRVLISGRVVPYLEGRIFV
ncbi:MAG: PhzF family phenazine biosynthesis protein [Pseudomonadota bacterium]